MRSESSANLTLGLLPGLPPLEGRRRANMFITSQKRTCGSTGGLRGNGFDKLDGAGYGWASALTGRLLPAARETSHLFSFEARRYLLSAWYQRAQPANMKGGPVTLSKFLRSHSSLSPSGRGKETGPPGGR